MQITLKLEVTQPSGDSFAERNGAEKRLVDQTYSLPEESNRLWSYMRLQWLTSKKRDGLYAYSESFNYEILSVMMDNQEISKAKLEELVRKANPNLPALQI